jgi:hypothetical protein
MYQKFSVAHHGKQYIGRISKCKHDDYLGRETHCSVRASPTTPENLTPNKLSLVSSKIFWERKISRSPTVPNKSCPTY